MAESPKTADPLSRLAQEAFPYVREGIVVGLGTGRAAWAFIDALAARVRQGWKIHGVATSVETERRAAAGGIPVSAPQSGLHVDVTVDGADEVDPHLDLIKGYGGALVREKIVATASRQRVILVTPEKKVPVLGTRGRLPVEVVPFASEFVRSRLEELGFAAPVRQEGSGPRITDNGNWILDVRITPQPDPAALDRTLRDIPGVVGTGFFLGMADVVLVGQPDGSVQRLFRGAPPA